MKWITLGIYQGVDRETFFLSDLPIPEYEDYLAETKRIVDGKVVKNEINNLINVCGKKIIRVTNSDVEIAFHRGGLFYLEQYQKRLKELESRYKDMRKKKQE